MFWWKNRIESLSDLVGETIEKIEHANQYDSDIVITLSNGKVVKMGHIQDCCESVYVEDIIGDLEDLCGTPLLTAEERTSVDVSAYGNPDREPYGYDSVTWTFYEFRTIKGSVTIRWCGESNGYYSESVDIWYA